MKENTWAVAEEVCLRIDYSPAPRGYISAFLVDRPENQFFYNREFEKSILESPTIKRVLFRGTGIFPS